MVDLSPADLVSLHESANRPFAGYSPPGSPPVDLSSAPLDETGFPIWEGRQGPAGISHAAGLYQFEPGTWRPAAAALGVKDFSEESQRKVFDSVYSKAGYAPWAPYNSTLAKAVGWTGPTGSKAQTGAIANAGLLGGASGPMTPLELAKPSPAVAASPTAPLEPAPQTPNLAPLLALGLAAPKHSFQPVDYDPFKIEKGQQSGPVGGPGFVKTPISVGKANLVPASPVVVPPKTQTVPYSTFVGSNSVWRAGNA